MWPALTAIGIAVFALLGILLVREVHRIRVKVDSVEAFLTDTDEALRGNRAVVRILAAALAASLDRHDPSIARDLKARLAAEDPILSVEMRKT